MSDLSQRYIEQVQRLKQSAKQFTAHYPALTEYLLRDKADPDVEMGSWLCKIGLLSK